MNFNTPNYSQAQTPPNNPNIYLHNYITNPLIYDEKLKSSNNFFARLSKTIIFYFFVFLVFLLIVAILNNNLKNFARSIESQLLTTCKQLNLISYTTFNLLFVKRVLFLIFIYCLSFILIRNIIGFVIVSNYNNLGSFEKACSKYRDSSPINDFCKALNETTSPFLNILPIDNLKILKKSICEISGAPFLIAFLKYIFEIITLFIQSILKRIRENLSLIERLLNLTYITVFLDLVKEFKTTPTLLFNTGNSHKMNLYLKNIKIESIIPFLLLLLFLNFVIWNFNKIKLLNCPYFIDSKIIFFFSLLNSFFIFKDYFLKYGTYHKNIERIRDINHKISAFISVYFFETTVKVFALINIILLIMGLLFRILKRLNLFTGFTNFLTLFKFAYEISLFSYFLVSRLSYEHSNYSGNFKPFEEDTLLKKILEANGVYDTRWFFTIKKRHPRQFKDKDRYLIFTILNKFILDLSLIFTLLPFTLFLMYLINTTGSNIFFFKKGLNNDLFKFKLFVKTKIIFKFFLLSFLLGSLLNLNSELFIKIMKSSYKNVTKICYQIAVIDDKCSLKYDFRPINTISNIITYSFALIKIFNLFLPLLFFYE